MKADIWNLSRAGGLFALVLVLLLPRAGGAQPASETGPADPASQPVVESVIAALPEDPPSTGRGEARRAAGDGSEPESATRSARRSKISQMVEVGGSAMVRSNQVAEGAVVVRGDARIDGDVDGDVVVVLGNVHVRGHIRGDLVVVMGEAELDGRVDGDVALVLTRSRIGSGADLRGELVAAGVAPDVDASARLRHEPEIISFGPLMRYFDWAKDYLFQGVFLLRPFPPGLGWVWVVAALCLGLNLLVGVLFAGALRGCMDTLRERPARSLLVGLLTCVLVGPVSLLLSFAVVATPLIWLAYFALCVFGRVAVYGAAGAGVVRQAPGTGHPFAPVLVGSLLFYVSYMVPVLGFFVYWLVLPWGVGAALIRLMEALRRERRDPMPRAGAGPLGGAGTPYGAASSLAGGFPGPSTHATVEPPPVVSDPGPGGGAGAGAAGTPPWGPAPQSPGFPPASPFARTEDVAVLPRVGFGGRLAATLIDVIAIAFVNAMTFQTGRAFWFLLAAYHVGMWVWKGTTLGGSVLGIRLVRLDGRVVDWQTALYRVLGAVISLLPLGLGFIWVAWDAETQSWHDRIAGTTVVKPDRRAPLVT